jgi:hypothetical protein
VPWLRDRLSERGDQARSAAMGQHPACERCQHCSPCPPFRTRGRSKAAGPPRLAVLGHDVGDTETRGCWQAVWALPSPASSGQWRNRRWAFGGSATSLHNGRLAAVRGLEVEAGVRVLARQNCGSDSDERRRVRGGRTEHRAVVQTMQGAFMGEQKQQEVLQSHSSDLLFRAASHRAGAHCSEIAQSAQCIYPRDDGSERSPCHCSRRVVRCASSSSPHRRVLVELAALPTPPWSPARTFTLRATQRARGRLARIAQQRGDP